MRNVFVSLSVLFLALSVITCAKINRKDAILASRMEKQLSNAAAPEKRAAIERIHRLYNEYQRHYPVLDCADMIVNADRNFDIIGKIAEYGITEESGTPFYVELAGYAAKAPLADEEFLILGDILRRNDYRSSQQALELGKLASNANTEATRREIREKIDSLENNTHLAEKNEFRRPDPESVKPYADFLAKGHAAPVDYIMGLFETRDIVVICERMHPEVTQWGLIYDIVSDERFIRDVGNIFTEYGGTNMQPYLEDFLETDGLSDDEADKRAVHLMRNISLWPVWSNENLYNYLKKLYALNQSLPRDDRIRHHFSDIVVDWENMTPEKYAALRKEVFPVRDRIMADNVEAGFKALQASADGRKKCLVIMNYRHGFGPLRDPDGKLLGNTCEYLYERFPGRAANVLLNTVAFDMNQKSIPVSGGRWDAAFKLQGDPYMGFDFAGSPFGEDSFDMFPFRSWIQENYTYQDVFTGFIFYKALNEHVISEGFPGLIDGFEGEVLRRAKCVSDEYYGRWEKYALPEFKKNKINSRKAPYGKFY